MFVHLLLEMIYMSTKSELLDYQKIFENELHGNILAYWMKYGVEANGKGFYGAVDLNNEPVPSANKTCVLNARILWTFAAAAKQYPGKGYEHMAHKAYRVINEDFADKEHGGFFMELDGNNRIASGIKHTYAQAFVIYSLSRYYEINPAQEVMDRIRDFFYFLEGKTKDPDHLGYFEAFTRDWNPYEENRMADNNEPRSMNTHLHLLEAYAAVFRIWKDELVKQRLGELLELFLQRIIREDGHLGIFFTEDFSETESSKAICSFGHDIEATWLIWKAAEILGDVSLLEKTRTIILKNYDSFMRED